MDENRELQRALKNLAGANPLTRLRAIVALRRVVEEALRDTFEAAELEQVRAALSNRATWQEIGDAVDLTRAGATKRYKESL